MTSIAIYAILLAVAALQAAFGAAGEHWQQSLLCHSMHW
jgi:hypothetical protein